MNHRGVQRERSSSDDWWKTNRSLAEIAEHLEHAYEDKQALERRLAELVEENERLERRSAEAAASHAGERDRLKTELSNQQLKAEEMQKRLHDKSATGRQQQAELPAKERLLKDELERKIQTLQLELKKERSQHAMRVNQLEAQLAGCICRDVRIENVEPPRGNSAKLPERWVIRNSK